MGFFSSIGNAIRGAISTIINSVEEIGGFIVNALGSVFLFWLTKKIRLNVVILSPGGKDLATVAEVEASVERLKLLIKQKFNTRIKTYGTPFIGIINVATSAPGLNNECSVSGYVKTEYEEAGNFFDTYTSPIPFYCPITAFIVSSIKKDGEEWRGCSSGLLTNYIILTPKGLNDDTTFAHELSHACNLFHRNPQSNLMYHGYPRGTHITRWQKWWFRASRHVNFW